MNTWDKHTDTRINTLHPLIRNMTSQFINMVSGKHNIKLRITSALRTFEEQDELYAQGRTKPGNKVTNAN